MKRIPSTVGRGFAGALFTVMLVVGVMKAQGCQRPVDDTPEAESVTENPTQTNAAEPAPTATAAQPEPAAIAEPSADAGAADAEAESIKERPMMPATKSGMPIRVQQNQAPKQQKSD